jgi:hypothetical protein
MGTRVRPPPRGAFGPTFAPAGDWLTTRGDGSEPGQT